MANPKKKSIIHCLINCAGGYQDFKLSLRSDLFEGPHLQKMSKTVSLPNVVEPEWTLVKNELEDIANDAELSLLHPLPRPPTSSSLPGAAAKKRPKAKKSTNVVVPKQQRNHINKPFTCPSCFKSYTMRCNLSRHRRVECGREPTFCCHVCQAKYYYRSSLVQHVKVMHNGDLNAAQL